MTVKMTLVKGPILQKLLLFTLITLSGLGFPPPLAEATKCYVCPGCSNEGKEKDCSGHCALIKEGNNQNMKDCISDGMLPYLTCVQSELGQSGKCAVYTEKEKDRADVNCGHLFPRGPNQGSIEEKVKAKARSGDVQTFFCVCTSDLCNTNSLVDGTSGGGEGGTSGAACNAVQIGMVTIFLLSMFWLFY